MTIPTSLRTWFLIHFIVDYLVALPLFFAPLFILNLFSYPGDPFAARIIACALFAIGGTSLLVTRKKTTTKGGTKKDHLHALQEQEQELAEKAIYNTLLTLKLIFSGTAILGILISLAYVQNSIVWIALGTYIIFFIVWAYYKRILL